MRKIIYLLFILASSVAQANWETAMKLYNEAKYDSALSLFQQQVEIAEGPAYYNIGNCYYKLNEFGKAMVYYEKALILDPQNEDIAHNIDFTKQHLLDKEHYIPPYDIPYFLHQLGQIITDTQITYLLIVLGLIVFFSYLLGVFIKEKRTLFNKTLSFSIPLTLVLWAFTVFVLPLKNKHVDAIVISEYANAYLTPQSDANTAFILHEGSKVNVLEKSYDEQFTKIRLNKEMVGWIESNRLEEI